MFPHTTHTELVILFEREAKATQTEAVTKQEAPVEASVEGTVEASSEAKTGKETESTLESEQSVTAQTT